MSSLGSAEPNGRSRLWPSPAPKPSLETVKFCTRNNWFTGASPGWSTTVGPLSSAELIAGRQVHGNCLAVSHTVHPGRGRFVPGRALGDPPAEPAEPPGDVHKVDPP